MKALLLAMLIVVSVTNSCVRRVTLEDSSIDKTSDALVDISDSMPLDQKTDAGMPLDQSTDVVIFKKNGVSCKNGSECTSRLCIEGVCCDSSCDDACKSCKVLGKEGQCSNVPSGQDLKNNCAGSNALCSGSCNGNGGCIYPGSNTSCGNDFCNGQGKLTTHQCDSKGGCETKTINVGWAISVPGGVDAIFPLSSGASVVSGDFEEPITFKTPKGDITLTGPGLYVAKIDISGNVVWVTALKGKVRIYDLHIDTSGNSYIVGDFGSDVTSGNIKLYSNGHDYEGYVAKLDSTGNFVWAKKFGGSNSLGADAMAVSVDANSNVYIAGDFQGENTIGEIKETSYLGSQDMFLTKYDHNGYHQWTIAMKGNGTEYTNDIVSDSNGNVYIIGDSYSQILDFGGKVVKTNNSGGIFVTKVTPNRHVSWLIRAGGAYYVYGYSITIDKKGDLYISGEHNSGTFGNISLTGSGGFIAKLSGEKGKFIWAKDAGKIKIRQVLAGIDGYLYTSGTFDETKTFGSSEYASKGSTYYPYEVYIAKVSPSDGKYLKAEASWGGAYSYDLSGISSGYLFSAGSFYAATDLGSYSLTTGPGYVWNLTCSSIFP